MGALTASKPTWRVWADASTYNYTGMKDITPWAWIATGPLGTQTGAERDAGTACHKAQAACVVLADER